MRWIAGGSATALLLVAGGLWLAREPIADSFIARELAKRGVQGRYEITRIGPQHQRLDNLVIGDPKSPDLTVRFIELELAWGLTGPYIDRLEASGVRLRGRIADGTLDLGQVSRLLEGGTGDPKLPDWTAVIEDAQARIVTNNGTVELGLDGSGPLSSGFNGQLNLASPALAFGDCRLRALRAPVDVATENGEIHLKGPAHVSGVGCEAAKLRLTAPTLDLNIRTNLALEPLGGAVSLAAPLAEQGDGRGKREFKELSGLITFKGEGDTLRGSASLAAVSALVDGLESDAAKLGGNFAVQLDSRNRALAWQGTGTIENARPARGINLARLASAADGSPLEPIAHKLARAVEAIGRRNHIELAGQVNLLGAQGNARLDRFALRSASGARIENWEGSAVRIDWPGGLRASGRLDIAGGDLPEGRIEFATQEQGGVRGTATLRPYDAGGGRLALTPLRFAMDGAGRGSVQTQVTLDGPLPGGAVKGLQMPLDARVGAGGAVSLSGTCVPLRWASLSMSGLVLDPAALQVCGLGESAAAIRDVALRGRLGDNPFAFDASAARYGLTTGRFEIQQPNVRIGAAEAPVRLAADRLTGGRGSAGGLAGTISAGRGRIGSVPLDLTAMEGQWQFADGRLAVDGNLRVADTQADRRFNPLAGEQVRLTLADNRIEATGVLVHPERKAKVADVVIRHDLSRGAGRADLTVKDLRFGNALQPDDLTPLSLGVVANVAGIVNGAGQIRWTGDKVTSDGTFSTENMAFAAAFGPVAGLSTTIRFTDLLGLRTEPGQVVTVESVNPGIEVRDGNIRYQLLSSEVAEIEGGRWPFSGGMLELMPAPLALDSRQPRNLTFRVVGLDAGAFINTLELENISATGIFDGLLPMVFDKDGGRIVGGLLVARQEGDEPRYLTRTQGLTIPCDPERRAGRLSYVGEVSNAQLNAMARLAFDALKNLGYRCLAIRLDGAIDGEFVTQVSINGVNQGTEETRRSFLARPFLGLPFLFNVRIEAPFRGLLNTATGLADPTKLINGSLGDQFVPVGSGASTRGSGVAVQPADSDKRIEGDKK
ncbi:MULTISPECIES: YdbH domain-containing protein [unclassified Sphingobium]|uniref:intermembrane phospholipid transport protein YdbH family protein n=1 Tax=unclassified Sphingobium TaxID=2611147 RepID=UPI002224EDC5|nr:MULTISPECIES: YdbH domain-containing protein [unclassified Sphingobium]MCW2394338.1 hypothetical protein [Sphingobium sp. B8D3B]MCW2417852.1 hypothetical protein [Sphingobium sp. B8D3C]